MAWWRWTPSKDPDDYREGPPTPSQRARPKDWPEGLPWDGVATDHVPVDESGSEGSGRNDSGPDDEDEEPEPRLRPRQHWGLVGAMVGIWIVAMAILGVHWWDFDRHGPWLTPLTPFAFAGALEGFVIARRPELNRHHDPDGPLRRRRKAHELGERARPYWAREGRELPPGDGS